MKLMKSEIAELIILIICVILLNNMFVHAEEYNSYLKSEKYNNGIVLPDDSFEDIQGDVNCDGIVNSEDALLVLKHVAKLISLSGTAYDLADMDGNDLLTADDALEILMISAKIK